MEIQAESKDSNNKAKNNNKKKDSKEDILNLLKKSKYGLNISQIVDQMDLSRKTVKKLIIALEQENLIKIKEIGRAKLCYIDRVSNKENIEIIRSNFIEIINNIIDSFEKVQSKYISDPANFLKEMGNIMGQKIKTPILTELIINESVEKQKFVNQVGKTIIKVFKSVNDLAGDMFLAEIVPFEPDEEPTSIKIRVQNISNEIKHAKSFYHFMVGFWEIKIREHFGENICIDVLDFQKESSICYFKIKFRND